MKANEARQKAMVNAQAKNKPEYQNIKKLIEKAVEDGEFRIYLNSINFAVKKALEDEGYDITENFNRNETTVTIFWGTKIQG